MFFSKPKSLWSVFEDVEAFVGSKGQSVDVDSLRKDNEFVLVYCSAHWCPPCKLMTPKLAQWYEENAAAKKFEIVFVSMDRNPTQFKEYLSEMPWLAVPFSSDAKDSFFTSYSIMSIPQLLLFRASDGALLETDARSLFSSKPAAFPWGHSAKGAEVADERKEEGEGKKQSVAGKGGKETAAVAATQTKPKQKDAAAKVDDKKKAGNDWVSWIGFACVIAVAASVLVNAFLELRK